jgi:hypothetical protein
MREANHSDAAIEIADCKHIITSVKDFLTLELL